LNDDHSITNNLGFIVKSMSFIIRNNKITSLKVGFETVKLFEGLMLNELINSGCLLHLKAKGENNQLDYFYITYGSSYIANSN
jgi:hypothetical protein